MAVGTHLVIRAAPSYCFLGEAIIIEFSGTADCHHSLMMRQMEKKCWFQDKFTKTQYYWMENVCVYVCVCACTLCRFSRVWLFATTWTVACQAPVSMGFSRQEYWNGLPFPPQGNLLDPGIEPKCLKFRALAGKIFTTSAFWEAWRMGKRYWSQDKFINTQYY